MPPLNGAIAATQGANVLVGVSRYLDLYVSTTLYGLFAEEPVVAEGDLRLVACGGPTPYK